MKYIKKGPEPPELTKERNRIRSTPGVGGDWYGQLDGQVRSLVKAQCLSEQGYLCGYTGLRIDEGTSHLEHMWPQSCCDPEEQIDYKNLIASFNGPDDDHPGFGAKEKGNWPDRSKRHLLVRPTESSCETRFHYDGIDGSIRASKMQDAAAESTIEKIQLDHRTLRRMRKEALNPIRQIHRVDALRKRVHELSQTTHGRFEDFAFQKRQYAQHRLKVLEIKVTSARRQKAR